MKKYALKNFAIFTGKHLRWSLFLIKVSYEYQEHLFSPILKNICELLLIELQNKNSGAPISTLLITSSFVAIVLRTLTSYDSFCQFKKTFEDFPPCSPGFMSASYFIYFKLR